MHNIEPINSYVPSISIEMLKFRPKSKSKKVDWSITRECYRNLRPNYKKSLKDSKKLRVIKNF